MSINTHMDKYIARTKGERGSQSEEDNEIDESLYVDERGNKIERSGGKEEIVKPSDSISNIKNKFGGQLKADTEFKRTTETIPDDEVDAAKVSSARKMFKEGEQRKQPDSPSLIRPTKKLQDVKEIMEMRKQITYANDEEIPQDNMINKSVVVEGVDPNAKHQALDVYKKLESQQ